MKMEILLLIIFWFALSVAVGMFAEIRRNRSGFGWFILALIISPLLAGIFCAILERKPESPATPPDEILARVTILVLCVVLWIVHVPLLLAICIGVFAYVVWRLGIPHAERSNN
jgi:hypothetical protein